MKNLSIETKRLIQQGYYSLYNLKNTDTKLLVIPKVNCGCSVHRRDGSLYELDTEGNIIQQVDYAKYPEYEVESVLQVEVECEFLALDRLFSK